MTLLAQAAQVTAGSTAQAIVFWVFAVLALGSALAVISMRNVVHGALMLVVNLLAIAGLFLTLRSPFLSIIQVLVYGGAIMVLFLFVIMLLGVDNDDLLAASVRGRALAVVGGAVLAGALLVAFVGPYTAASSICADDAPAPAAGEAVCVGTEYAEDDGAGAGFLGRSMFTTYTYPFELAAVLLTVATIGAVVIARRRDLEPEDEDLDAGDQPVVTVGEGGGSAQDERDDTPGPDAPERED
ncbi:MAG: NADH-quinone oxidoreductase subunit J [Nitriliruptoraceae bacterium]